MDKTSSKSVEDYIAAQAPAVRALLQRVRRTVRKAVPDAEESISYGIPTYKLHRRPVLYFAAWKEHYSLYPSNAQLVAAFRNELAPYEVEKGTIRFPLSGRVPLRLIAGIAKFRAQEVAAPKPKRTAVKKR
jgi:uncharacterized protein YdhG (YjbR/CyaY superfamily)